MNSGIYRIVITEPATGSEMYYVGQSRNLRVRAKCHLYDLRNGTHWNRKMQREFTEFGEACMRFEIILECAADKHVLALHEQAVLDSQPPGRVFNIRTKCVTSSLGVRASDERKAKIAAALTGIARSDETKRRVSLGNAWKRTDEGRAKLSAAAKGRLPSAVTKEKMALRQYQRHADKAVLQNGSSWMLY